MPTDLPLNYCPIHRLPRGREGCPQCARAIEKERRKEQAKIVRQVSWSVGALVVAATIWLFTTRDRTQPGLIDPEPFRPQIERFEASLFHTGRLGADARQELLEAGQALGLAFRKAGPFLPRKAMEELDTAVFMTSVGGDKVGDNIEFPALRKGWEETRARHFREATWFAHGSAALDEAQKTGEARGLVPDTAPYEHTLRELEALVNRIEFDSQRLQEGNGSGDEWSAAKKAIEADVERIRAGMPPAPRNAHSAWVEAWRKLDVAVSSMPRALREPWGSKRARSRVAEAERAFRNAPRE